MLPRIAPEFFVDPTYQDFLRDLTLSVFSGDIHSDYAARLSVAVDNSIYQVIPQAVIFPRDTNDIAVILKLASYEKYKNTIQFCARGGGTSTNGQSLTAGIIIDCSRYMRQILELNLEQMWVKVQPGVILDQLNDYLRPYGVSFAPEISPSNRATIGGMVNTDACGTGSRILGRTCDHVLDLTCVLNNGSIIHSADLSETKLGQQIKTLLETHSHLINEKFTNAPRTLNGYNLKKSLIDLTYLFCGSEGTLAVIGECKLKLTVLPKFKKLLIVKYRNFDDALRAVDITADVNPFAIEAIDEKLVMLARTDSCLLYTSPSPRDS